MLQISLVVVFIFFTLSFIPQQIYGYLGNGQIYEWDNNNLPASKANLSDIKMVDTGELHNLALKSDGTVWAWGYNQNGQLGNGTTNNSTIPVQVKGPNGNDYLKNIVMIAAGERYSMALDSSGIVWMWGFNNSGYRGTGDLSSSNLLLPQKVRESSDFTHITRISAGSNHSLAINSTGTVFAWGVNSQGVIGIGCTGTIFCPNTRFPRPILNNSIDISAGNLHSIAVKEDGSVWGWGRNAEGQLGKTFNSVDEQYIPSQIPNLAQIKKSVTKYNSNIVQDINGKIFSWGSYINPLAGNYSPLELPLLQNSVSFSTGYGYPGKVIVLAVKDDGKVLEWNESNNPPTTIAGLANIASVSVKRSLTHLAVEKIDSTPTPTPTSTPTPTPSTSPTPVPFLELPWDYKSDGNTFSDAALTINSYFDHEYPLLSDKNILEGDDYKDSIVTFMGLPRSTTKYYSRHDGYDWGKSAKANLRDDVLAAASGAASFKNTCTACGNMIVIDHGNGYQTKYMHLLDTGLITNDATTSVQVTSGQKIGEVGSTGNSSGPHIHFGVFQDKDNDGSFGNNFTDGATDPFGWQSNDTDPWPLFTFTQGGVEKSGNYSYYLWKNKIDSTSEEVPIQGKKITVGKYTFDFPPDSTYYPLKIDLLAAPNINPSNDLSSLGTIIKAQAKNNNGDNVSSFDKPFTLKVDYSNINLQRYKIGTLSIYSSPDGDSWTPETTTVDPINKIATSTIDHMTYFALMAERVDTIPPTTNINFQGEMGDDKWFRSDVKVSLEALDNENGLGIYYTGISTNDEDWSMYTDPLYYDQEGSYSLSFYSVDNDENTEDTKKETFFIDKTLPLVDITSDKSTLWPPNGKLIPIKLSGSATDDNLSSHWVVVTDEYQEISPIITTFDQTIYLPASRQGDDIDGRTYTVKAQAEDKAGNLNEKLIYINVPHDMNPKIESAIPVLSN